jgi:fibronectin type 3 domain-containing protein
MKKFLTIWLVLTLVTGIAFAQESLMTIGGTGTAATSAHMTVTAAGSNKAYLCPDEFSIQDGASISTWGYEATCGALPKSPMNLQAVGWDEYVNLSWDDNPEPDITNYHIARAAEPGVVKTHLAGVDGNTTSYKDEDVTNGQMYYYVVWASDNYANESPRSNEAAAMPQDVDAPCTPENFAAEAGDGEVTLTWDDCPETDIDVYHLYRALEIGVIMEHLNGVAGHVTTYVDTSVTNGQIYYYKIAASDEANNLSDLSDYVSATPEAVILGTDDTDYEQALPENFSLEQNYPNPFNPTTTINYTLPEATEVTIVVYDMMGREVKTLVSEHKDAGYHSITWDATNDRGNRLSGGIYLYSIHAGSYYKTQKMVLLK